VSIRKAHPLRGEFVDVWCGNLSAGRIVTLHIAVAEIVGEDDDDVRLITTGIRTLSMGRCNQSEGQYQQGKAGDSHG
jgi:hypothetical protein